jgi:aminopeptidase N
MNTGSGKNLNWFWKRWFIDGGVPDLSLKVKKQAGYKLTIDCKGNKPVPVDVTLTYEDGSTEKIHRSIAVWEKSSSISFSIPEKKALKAVLLGSTYVPDVNRKDNIWNNK